MNVFALFLLLFICLVVKGLSSDSLSGLGVGGGKVGGGGGGLLGLGGLVQGTAGAGVACAASKAISSAFLNLEYLFNPLSFGRAFSSGTYL